MALVVLELPGKTIYKFTNTTGGTVPDYTVQVSPEVAFTPDIKALSEDGVRRYIINPTSVSTGITGTYTANSKAFTISQADLAAIKGGSYQKFAVDGGSSAAVTVNYNIQIGDFLMRDGSLLPKGTTPTDEQKSNIAAIVFWTPAETATTGRTYPASLSDDKIMAADYPGCTHGLAVALKNIGSTVWQKTSESVASFQSSTNFNPTSSKYTKSDFKSIAASDPINCILGYQNTQILKAYNRYCKDNGKTGCVMLPVDKLDDFTAINPAPAGSTGWFIPSPKELFMLGSKDSDSWEGSPETANTVDISIKAVSGSTLLTSFIITYYTSSEMYASYTNTVTFASDDVAENFSNKANGGGRCRAVCAF